ncbi:ATP-binding domain-containing protein 4 [Capsaspora owczarzaki ATCC 30864]|uniref:Diphthine--ammonia ligase n=1 Tax=Capsaspora owczarzaki (strain ATCC 30864) TaxID=595528 RepID=A0A0D2VX01_CAPO3|nr:ATP-binding domain-containing protein 4 [Capsaspora owczarzaki ATCC 30864]KJE96102.1 ATP-binding domain-containing protein 4 [Capsaspora owczarzaki ATCC 30864]|eukprot:XP_004345220.2 ATP-binding domain-containing protein 4 [Capsaspora owczarzaki ATCC 30864]
MKVVGLLSGGKDSCFNMMHCVAMGHELVALANLMPAASAPDELDSFMYQTVGHEAVDAIARALELPLVRRAILGTSLHTELAYDPSVTAAAAGAPSTVGGGPDEVEDLFALLQQVKELHPEVEAVSVGAIASDYQRLRVEHVCKRLGLTSLAFMWRRPQADLMREMIDAGLEAILIKVAAVGLEPRKHLGKTLGQVHSHLQRMNEMYGLHICGEGGEYESFTVDCPLFRHRIVVDETEIVVHSHDPIAPVAYLRIKKLHLEPKDNIPSQRDWALDAERLRAVISTSNPFQMVESYETLQQHLTLCEDAPLAASTSEPVINASQSEHYAPSHLQQAHGHVWVGLITPDISVASSVDDQIVSLFEQLVDRLRSIGTSLAHVSVMHLHVADLANFGRVNAVYGRYFDVSPASRICIQVRLPPGIHAQLDCVASVPNPTFAVPADLSDSEADSDGEDETPTRRKQARRELCEAASKLVRSRRVMHVQGMSHWAPANIGPYSQSVQVGNLNFVAGQIPLVPGTMTLLRSSESPLAKYAEQTWLALGHLHQVLSATSCDLARVPFLICYVLDIQYGLLASQLFQAFVRQHCQADETATPPLTLLAQVPALPRAASVELETVAVIAATRWTKSKQSVQHENLTASLEICSNVPLGWLFVVLTIEHDAETTVDVEHVALLTAKCWTAVSRNAPHARLSLFRERADLTPTCAQAVSLRVFHSLGPKTSPQISESLTRALATEKSTPAIAVLACDRVGSPSSHAVLTGLLVVAV